MLKLGSSRKTKFMKTACKVVPIFPIVKLRYLILLWKEFLCSQENLETWDALYIIRIWVVSVHSSSLVANMTSTQFLYYIEVKINTTFLVSWSKRKEKDQDISVEEVYSVIGFGKLIFRGFLDMQKLKKCTNLLTHGACLKSGVIPRFRPWSCIIRRELASGKV